MAKSKLVAKPIKLAAVRQSEVRPEVAITLHGVSYRLCFSFGALRAAQEKFREQGNNINMLFALDFSRVGPKELPALFYAAAFQQHPELCYEEAERLVDFGTWEAVFCALVDAYLLAMPPVDREVSANPSRVKQG